MSIDNTLFGRIQLHHFAIRDLIQWSDNLSVEHPGIDAQHKAIFETGTKVYDNWRSGGNVQELRRAATTLDELLKTHFAYEERLLTEINYAELEQHAAEHRGMLSDMDLIKERFQAIRDDQTFPGSSMLAPGWPVLHFFLGFAVGHVMNSDMRYCQALMASRDEAEGEA